jgi:hypothetical protein
VAFPDLVVTTHLEPIEDEESFEKEELSRLGESVK